MPTNGMENAAIEETLYITFVHLKLCNIKEKKGVLIIFFTQPTQVLDNILITIARTME